MIVLRWTPYPEASVSSFNIYRSIVGFRAILASPSLLSGLTLTLRMNDQASQTITFSGPDSAIDQINAALVGGRAYESENPNTSFIVRSDIRGGVGKVEIISGTALTLLGLTPRVITEKSESEKVGSVPRGSDPVMEFEDCEGALCDWYAITSVDNIGNESLKTAFRQPTSSVAPLCVLEGLIVDLHGVRMPDQEVRAHLIELPNKCPPSYITRVPVSVLSGPDGRYSIPLLQNAIIQLTIPSTGYSRTLKVPEQPYAYVSDLPVNLDYRYPLGAEE